MSRRLHVIHTVASLGASAGGPSRTVPALCAAVTTECRHISVEIVTGEAPAFGRNIETEVPTHTFTRGVGASGQRSLLNARIEHALGAYDNVLLHDHGQWLGMNRASAHAARTFGLQRIVSPRGMLSPWALRHRACKKRLAWWLYARRDLLQAAAVHATSQQEANEIGRLGYYRRIAVIPNGVQAPANLPSDLAKGQTVVFLSRLHPKKGVQELVTAWRALQPTGWRLILAGPDEARMVPKLDIGAKESIDYIGEVDGDAKWALLGGASVVVLPSYSENFGVVVAEALMAGTPVIATHGAPWEGLAVHRCGWWIPMEPESLIATLRDAVTTAPRELAAMGQRGKEWVTHAFTWPAIGRAMGKVYESLTYNEHTSACDTSC